MKKRINETFIQTVLRAGLCCLFLSGMAVSTYAQEEVAAEDNVETTTRIRKAKEVPSYTMRTVKGTITDAATGLPMGGVRIQALNQKKYSTLTEEDGTYILEVPTFVFSLYVDAPEYNPIHIAIKGDENQNGQLYSAEFEKFYFDGTKLTASSEVTLDQTSSITVETDIQNKLAADIHSTNRSGLPGQGAYMSIRGVNSINANAQPLYVIDGNIVDLQFDRTSLHEGYFNNILAGLDPENVESIKVLKNGTALYGAKGANGVIIINTKRGKSMATKINVRVYGGVELAPKTLDVMDGNSYSNYLGDLVSTMNVVRKNNSYGGMEPIPFLNNNPDEFFYPLFHNNTDWQKDMYQTAFTQNYKINVEGGDDVGMYSLSLGYTASESTGKGTDFDRLNLRFNTDIEVFKNLNTSIDIAYNQTTYNILDNGWSENYDMQNIGSTNVLGLTQAPFLSPYAYYINEYTNKLSLSSEYAGKYASTTTSDWITNPFAFPKHLNINEALRNPYWILENGEGNNKNYAELTQISINVAPKWQITKQLSLSNRFNYVLNRNNEKYFLPINGATEYDLTDMGSITSVLKSQFTKETTINNDLRLEWANNYGAHTIDVFGGWRYNNYSYSYTFMRGYNNENDKLPNINKNMKYVNYDGVKDNWIDMTYYLNADYNYQNKYFAQVSASAQSSSRFGKETKDGFQMGGVSWGIFPSLQLGWLISSEPWFKTSRALQYLKMTAGVDQSGNDNIDNYATRTYWESQFMSSNTSGLVLKNIENSSIQWETTTRYNIGLEASGFDNRINAGIDFFVSKTDNLLTLKDIPYVSGMGKYWTNEGALENRGFEARVNAILLNKKDWKWQLGASVGHYTNEITKLPSTDVMTLTDRYGNVTNVINGYTSNVYGEKNILTAVGEAAGSFYGYATAGVFASDADARCNNGDYLKYPTGIKEDPYRNFQAGDVHFVDQNGDGVIDEADKIVLGNPNPDIYGNIFSSVSYKRLRLDVNFKYSLGNDVYNYQRSVLESGNTTYNQTTAMVNRWTYEGQQTSIPRACYTDSEDWRNNERFSDRWIEDGSYLKLKNVRLTYDFPIHTTWLQGLKVWGEANDVFTLTKYLGTDPETSCNNNVLYRGIDNGLLSLGRSFNFGVSINL